MDRLDRLRARYRWLDHLVVAGRRYRDSHGDHYAAAITYFSVLALVPLLMIAFAIAGFVLASQEALVADLQAQIAEAAPGTLGETLNDAIDEAIASRTAVGVLGLLGAAYSGLGWMGNLREAVSALWAQPSEKASFVRTKAADALALAGLGLAILASFAITAAGGAFAIELLRLVGLDEQLWARVLLVVVAVVLSLTGNWLVFLWAIARLPREPVTLRSAARGALAGAIGFEIVKQLGAVFLRSLGGSPAATVFGPVFGLLVFVYVVSRLLLFVTAWAATAPENERPGAVRGTPGAHPPGAQPGVQPDAPPPAVIRPNVTVRADRASAGLFGAGALAGAALATALRRRRPPRT